VPAAGPGRERRCARGATPRAVRRARRRTERQACRPREVAELAVREAALRFEAVESALDLLRVGLGGARLCHGSALHLLEAVELCEHVSVRAPVFAEARERVGDDDGLRRARVRSAARRLKHLPQVGY
jgi:hypothetical protein